MPEEHPNVELVRRGFEAISAGDAQWVADHLADDAVWHVGGKSRIAGAHRGKDAVLALFARQSQMLGSAPPIEVHDVVGNDRHVIAIGKATVPDPDGGTVEWRYANVFHIVDGKVAEAWGLADETSESDALIDRLIQ